MALWGPAHRRHQTTEKGGSPLRCLSGVNSANKISPFGRSDNRHRVSADSSKLTARWFPSFNLGIFSIQPSPPAPNPAKPEPKFHRMEDMSALRAKTEAGWVLAGALVLSGFLFFRYLEGYVISTGGRDLVHLEFLKPEDFSLRSK
uniref:Uncharacterized protein n=1 Tax=Candidatus Kentrum sp. LFY TaxID=2126342 RepID=A0A450U6L3_9GAMM|nr:MAG: hypothetical protein BECKLFY1418B_GA0070995_10061 [Candidatus Kentron sp. LFY]